MNTPFMCRYGNEPEVWLCWENSPFRIHIKSMDQVNVLKYIGVADKGSIPPVFKNFSSKLVGG